MSDSGQNYENHRSYDPVFLFASVLILAALICAGIAASRRFTLGAAAGIMAVAALAIVQFKLRRYAVRLQDRIIRLEMELRLARVLAGELAERAKALTLRQLIGLRFASDEELPALAAKVLDENIAKADDIKRLVKNWRADNLRV